MRFVDTSYWVALFHAGDPNHETADALWGSPSLLATNHILGETWTYIRKRLGHAAAVESCDAIVRSPSVKLLRVEEAEEKEAWRWLRRHDERKYSFVDATSFVVMRRRRLREALAFDGDFSAAGFVEVRP